MKKGVISGIIHQKDFIYFKIEPDVSVIYILDEISSELDEYEEGLMYPNKDVDYDEFVPNRFSFYDDQGTIYAIVICNKDLIDLILFKNNSKFDKFMKLIEKNFSNLDEYRKL